MDAGKVFGRGIAFPPRIGEDGRLAWSEGPENVRESIRIILMTELGERLMLPEFGAGLGAYLFEPNTATTRRLIQERISDALARWEPRVKVEGITVEADPANPEAAIATISYQLVANQTRERVTLQVDLGAGERG
jgi:phage baseplate assembly protein W